MHAENIEQQPIFMIKQPKESTQISFYYKTAQRIKNHVWLEKKAMDWHLL